MVGVRPWGVSAIVHAVGLVALSLWFMPMLTVGSSSPLVASIDSEQIVDQLEHDELVSQDFSRSTGNLTPENLDNDAIDKQPVEVDVNEVSRVDVHPARPPELESVVLPGGQLPLEVLMTPTIANLDPSMAAGGRGPGSRPPSGKEEVREASAVAEAVDVVTGKLKGELDYGDTLVIWLLDASISLVGDRAQVAERMEEFYRSIDAFGTTRAESDREHELMNAVVAYGNHTMEILKPTRFGGRVVEAINQVPADVTGLENVMSAVQWCVYYYCGKKRHRERIMIVVWTDESGDDILMLEQTVALCRYAGVVVHAVGPSAVLGSDQGSHLWVDPPTGYRFLLPVKRGPDTSLPERVMLPYWFESSVPPWRSGGATVEQGTPWYGGSNRERLLSGFGPYALTRLALETGGTFTLFDRSGDRGRFRLDAMRDYLPSYESPGRYLMAMEEHPLRKACSEVAIFTHTSGEPLRLPRFQFMGGRSTVYPYSFSSTYMPQATFRRALAKELVACRNQAAAGYAVVQRALAAFQPNAHVNMAEEYEAETSPRWRAWHDLNRGRLMAVSVRYQEYIALCEMLLSRSAVLRPTTNAIVLHPAPRFRIPSSKELAAEATELLQRCVESNPETPWMYLAQWELEKPFGITVQEIVVPPPPRVPATGGMPMRGGGGPSIQLPNL